MPTPNITFQQIMNSYYALYRADGTTPLIDGSDPEYATAISLANNAIKAWARDNGVLWRELWTSVQVSAPSSVIAGGTINYALPANFKFPGNVVTLTNPGGGIVQIPVLENNQWQNQSVNSSFVYVTGDPNHGFTMNMPYNTAQYSGWAWDMPYYKQATLMIDVTSVPEMSDTEFMVHYMLAMRFRASRNWSGYQTAMSDAQNTLKNMEHFNAMQPVGNEWNIMDNDNTAFGF